MQIEQQLREYLKKLHGDQKRQYFYHIATSSGKAVSEEIPILIGKRVAWAAQQGASFVEVAFGPVSELVMQREELINSARQLGLNYAFHPSESLGLDASYATAAAAGFPFQNAQQYLRESVIAIGNFKKALEEQTGNRNTVTSVNFHAATGFKPPFDERLASDLSLDPFEIQTDNLDPKGSAKLSPIYKNRIFLERLWYAYFDTPLRDSPDFQAQLADQLIPERAVTVCEDYLDAAIRDMPERLLERFNLSREEALRKPPKEKRDLIENSGLYQIRTIYQQAAQDTNALRSALRQEYLNDLSILRTLAQPGAGFFGPDDFMKESFVYRELLPRWMPHADHQDKRFKPVRELWEEMTFTAFPDNGSTAEDQFQQKFLQEEWAEDRMIAAVAGAYVWGHMTQVLHPALNARDLKTEKPVSIAQLFDHFDLKATLESHMLTQISYQLRLYYPKDLISVAKAINDTKGPDGKKHDIARITIDMEQISTSGIDPLELVDPEMKYDDKKNIKRLERQGLRWLENKDGRWVKSMHVTHPYLMEQSPGHQHGPIRRGDVLNFQYIYTLTQKQFAQNPDDWAIIMYEIGSEKAESVFMLRLIMEMIEAGVTPQDLKVSEIQGDLIEEEPQDIQDQLIREFFELSRAEMMHEWQVIQENALEPIDTLLGSTKPSETWTGTAAIQQGRVQPQQYQQEEYQ